MEGNLTGGRLFVVSTPIGNMGDFSFRAVETLRSAKLVLAEDTRHTRTLLSRYEIATPMASYREHNEARMTPTIVKRLLRGEDIALVSDAGTPLVSDPGQRLVRAALDAGIRVVPVPGASAVLAALVACGIETDGFTFHGFLPRKGRERSAALDEAASSPRTFILYEAPGRLADTLDELASRAPERDGAVARELTKQFEEVRRGTLQSLAAYYSENPPRGEIVIVVSGAPPAQPDPATLADDARALKARGLTVRDVAAELTRRGVARNVAYRVAREAGE